MKSKLSKKFDPNQDVRDEVTRIMASSRFIFGFMGILLGISLSLGILVSLIAAGIWIALILMGQTFDPPYQLLRAVLHFGNLPSHLNQVSLWEKVSAFVGMLVPVLFVYIGIRGLQVGGFCMQSPICALAGLLSP